MRTTLDIDDRVLAHARTISAEQRISLGAAVSELALRGLEPRIDHYATSDLPNLPGFRVAGDLAPLTPEMVREAMES